MNRKVLLFVLIAVYFTGCTQCRKYCIELRTADGHKPVINLDVKIESLPRFYSFADPRHYIIGCGIVKKAQGVTDDTGSVTMLLETDYPVSVVIVDEYWELYGPVDGWNKMEQSEDDDRPKTFFEKAIEVKISEVSKL